MYINYTEYIRYGKISRYNQTGKLIQTIEQDNAGLEFYLNRSVITENNNGDIVVSDSNAVVVTDREGIHGFSYKGDQVRSVQNPYRSRLWNLY